MDDSELISSKAWLNLDLPPSSVQFCPAHPQYFVVGTYNLEQDDPMPAGEEQEDSSVVKKSQSRNGSLVLFRVEGDDLAQVQTLSQPSAILDLRFHADREIQDFFATVSSTGTLSIFRLNPLDHSSPLQHLATSRCDDLGEDILFLQCNWHPALRDTIAVTASNGTARILYLDAEWMIKGFHDLDIQNTLEAWSIALSPPSVMPNQQESAVSVYCGGDDSAMRYTSCSWKPDGELDTPYDNLMTIQGHHDAGVTAILPLPLFTAGNGRLVITGSYDEYLRVFSIHDLHTSFGARRVELLADARLGGGVWRLDVIDMHSSDKMTRVRILASCMHAGSRVVEISQRDGLGWDCRVLARFEEHKSMNYGSDSMSENEGVEGGRLRCVSTSFYDRLLCLWECKLSRIDS